LNRQNLKGNWPMLIGALCSFIYFGVGHFIQMPDFLRGLLLGISAAGYIVGALVAKYGFARIRNWKKRLLHRGR
jgi:hypothetical protein